MKGFNEYDVIVVGGGHAGLAHQFFRLVIVVDAGEGTQVARPRWLLLGLALGLSLFRWT